jgi:Xaa-Pro aminopeptidase
MRAAAPGSSFRDVTRGFRLLRVDKSEEELEWLRRGARLTDLALASLAENARPGMRERELAGVMERSYATAGGTTALHYVASTPMSAPDRCVPAQVLSERELSPGDLILTEISVAYGGYAGQGLRSYTVAAEPSPLIAELHELALSVYDAVAAAIVPGATQEDVWSAADVIAERGYTICDGLVHGYGMGILPPGMRTRQTSGPEAARPWTFAAGQTVVVQPNVVTEDQSAGVQVGDLCVVTERGAESLHAFPRELVRCG